MPTDASLNQPSLACRIVRLTPAEHELRDSPLEQLHSNTYMEWAIIRLHSGEEIEIFDPSLDSLDRQWIGRRCLLELAAFLGDCDLLADHTPPGKVGIQTRELIGRISFYYRDGFAVDVGTGSVGVVDQVDDRLEPGRIVRVSDFRLDFKRLVAFEADGSPGSWDRGDEDPFSDLPRALHALRSGETRTDYMPGIELDKDLKVIAEFESPYVTLWGQSVANLIYRLGSSALREAEPDIAAFLQSDDTHARRAAVWVLSRYWRLTDYRDALSALALRDGDVHVRKAALIGTGILLRGTQDREATQLFARILRDTSTHWFAREAAYLALLGLWLPHTAAVREAWRGWRMSESGRGSTWDNTWADRVDWELVSRLERGRTD